MFKGDGQAQSEDWLYCNRKCFISIYFILISLFCFSESILHTSQKQKPHKKTDHGICLRHRETICLELHAIQIRLLETRQWSSIMLLINPINLSCPVYGFPGRG